jgi:hypothetical protein
MSMRTDDLILDWLGAVGAAGADDVALACGVSAAVARGRLAGLGRAGFCRSARLLHAEPPLHAPTRAGLRASGRSGVDPVTFSAASFAHQQAVARVAARLGAAGSDVHGERELRAWERAAGRAIASAEVGYAVDGGIALHRPDLVCLGADAPIAIEVELTVKAPERLCAIVRGWARSRVVNRVVYYAAPGAARALERALRRESAGERIAVVPLDHEGSPPSTSSIPSAA